MSESADRPDDQGCCVTVLNFQIQFPKVALTAMASGKAWSGRVECSIAGDAEASRARRRRQTEKYELSEDERQVVDHWNALPITKRSAELIQAGHTGQRNQPVRKSLTTKERVSLRTAIEVFSTEGLKNLLDQYGRQCNAGNNFVKSGGQNRNLAYRDLPSLLVRLIQSKQDNENLWWFSADMTQRIQDADQQATQQIARLYGKKFCGGREPDLDGRDYNAVMRFRDALRELHTRYRMFSWEQLVQQGFGAAREYFPGKMIYPAHLGNQKFLQIGLPQYLKRLM